MDWANKYKRSVLLTAAQRGAKRSAVRFSDLIKVNTAAKTSV
jgi:hypothetical protein